MISGLLSNLQSDFAVNQNRMLPRWQTSATNDPNGLSGLLQTTGVPMMENPMGMRTPNYIGLLGMLGQQPFTPGYTGIGGAAGAPGQSDYLDRILGGMSGQAAPKASGNAGDAVWVNGRFVPSSYINQMGMTNAKMFNPNTEFFSPVTGSWYNSGIDN